MRNKKNASLLLLLLSVMAALSGCGGKPVVSPAATVVLDAVLASQPFEEMTTLPKEKLVAYLNIDAAQLADAAMAIDASRATPECVVVLTATDASGLDALQRALSDYRDRLLAEYRDYRPEEAPKLENAALQTKGLQTVLAVCADAGKAEQALQAAWQ